MTFQKTEGPGYWGFQSYLDNEPVAPGDQTWSGLKFDTNGVLEKVSEDMEAGDVSGVIEAQGHVFIMKLEEKRDAKYEPFEDVQEEVMTQLDLQRREIKLDNMISKLMSHANIEGMEAFVDFCVRSAYHKCNQN